MGRMARKHKLSSGGGEGGGVAAVIEVGVRTRSKTLALQQQQQRSFAYLELRSRRLEMRAPSSRLRASRKGIAPNPTPSPPKQSTIISISTCDQPQVDAVISNNEGSPDTAGGIQASFGDNALQLEDDPRNDRESTPCSLIRDSTSITPPGSSTRPSKSTHRRRESNDACKIVPSSQDMEDIFAKPEKVQQKNFAEKYNFDPVKDRPLPGRYEWVKLDPKLQ